MRGICEDCGVHKVTSRGYSKSGVRSWSKKCSSCKKKPWVKHKGSVCELCGFVPVNRVQLDVDHIDGDKSNDDLNNLQTLCANCHRLETFLSSDWQNKERNELQSLQMYFEL